MPSKVLTLTIRKEKERKEEETEEETAVLETGMLLLLRPSWVTWLSSLDRGLIELAARAGLAK